ncbi:hypothetical protein KC367_g106 [Hortaea werneckii]|nr:hypothetical protein KC367_g106 [Hortaea werneckii]
MCLQRYHEVSQPNCQRLLQHHICQYHLECCRPFLSNVRAFASSEDCKRNVPLLLWLCMYMCLLCRLRHMSCSTVRLNRANGEGPSAKLPLEQPPTSLYSTTLIMSVPIS